MRNTVEAELDIETVLSLAPQANIEVYEGGPSDGIYNVLSRIVSDDTAKIVSASWTNGCESYVSQSLQNSENTLLQAAAVDGQSVFVATGDEGAQGCNVNGVTSAPTGSNPVAQVVDATTGTAYVANQGSNTVSVDSEGTTDQPVQLRHVELGRHRDGAGRRSPWIRPSGRCSWRTPARRARSPSSRRATCNQTTTSGCASPTQVPAGGHLSNPDALAAVGSTLYVGNASTEPSLSTTPIPMRS